MDCQNNTQKNSPLRDIVATLTNTPLYKTGPGVFQTGLFLLCFHPVDMHTPSPKIEEDIEFLKEVSAKQLPGKD
jgi:hypothetical protein